MRNGEGGRIRFRTFCRILIRNYWHTDPDLDNLLKEKKIHFTIVAYSGFADPDLDPHNFGKPDPHQSEKLDPEPDPHQSEKLDPEPDPHYSQNSEAVEAQNGAMECSGAV